MKVLTRRSAIRRTMLATAAAAATRFASLMPELSLVGGVGSPLRNPNAKIRARELRGRELDQAVGQASTRGGAGALYSFLARAGFQGSPTESSAVAFDSSDGAVVGRTVVTTFRDREHGATARVVHQLAASETKTSMAIWSDAQPQLLSVYRATGGDATMIGTITIGADDIVVDDLQTGRVILPRHMPRMAATGKSGTFMAVPPTAPTSPTQVCHEVCGWVVGMYCGLVCEYTFFVVCSVILLLTGLPGLACFLISFATCFTACYYVQSWVCTSVCE